MLIPKRYKKHKNIGVIDMSSPCSNCGSDFKVCIECDFYNGKYIEKSVLDDIKAEIKSNMFKDNQITSNIDAITMSVWNNAILDVLEIIDKHMKGDTDADSD